jgi:uncharacterized protein with HEPN domain
MAGKLAPILADILTAITGIETAVTNMTLEEFEKNWIVNHAVQRALEINFRGKPPHSIRDQADATEHTLGQHCRYRQCITTRLQ